MGSIEVRFARIKRLADNAGTLIDPGRDLVDTLDEIEKNADAIRLTLLGMATQRIDALRTTTGPRQ
jgi:hypothetical protein